MPERPGSASRSFPEPAPRPARLPHGRGPGEARSLPQLPQSRRLHAQGRLPPRQGAQERRRMPRQALPPLSAPRSAGSSLHVPWRASLQSFLPRNRGSLSLCRRAATGRRPPYPHDLHDIGLRELLLEPSQRTSKLQGSSRIEALLVAEHLLLLEEHLLACGCLARRHLRHPSHRFLLGRQKRGR